MQKKVFNVPIALYQSVIPTDKIGKTIIINIVEDGMSPYFKTGDAILAMKTDTFQKGKVYALEHDVEGVKMFEICFVFWHENMDTDQKLITYHTHNGQCGEVNVDDIVSINEVMLQYDGKQKKWMVFNFNRKPMSARSKILNLPLLVTLYKIWIETGEYKAVRMG